MKSIEKLLNYSIALVVIAIAVSFFLFKTQKQNSTAKPKMTNEEVDKVVNKYLQQAVDENKRNQWKTEKALREARLKVEKDMETVKRKQDEELQKIPAERQIWTESEMAKMANQASQENSEEVTLQKTKSSQSEEFDIKSMTPEEKKEYARQYIENARRGGYLIELDQNMEVIKSTPIRKPSQQEDSVDNLNGG